MKKFDHREYIVYEIWVNRKKRYKNLLLIYNRDKVQFFNLHNKEFVNWKFKLSKFLLIRLPGVYIHKNNKQINFGSNRLYLNLNF
jgi:hypothetical protein